MFYVCNVDFYGLGVDDSFSYPEGVDQGEARPASISLLHG